MNEFRTHLQRAIDLKEGQSGLARAVGCSQQQIWWLMNEAKNITYEMAVKIERATDGKVRASDLRPDMHNERESAS